MSSILALPVSGSGSLIIEQQGIVLPWTVCVIEANYLISLASESAPGEQNQQHLLLRDAIGSGETERQRTIQFKSLRINCTALVSANHCLPSLSDHANCVNIWSAITEYHKLSSL